MAIFELVLILLATVLASAIIDQLFTRIPLPLIQIVCGVALAVIAGESISVTLIPDLFLVLFIAPLLFNEAQAADKASLWHNRHSMLSYAIGLVVAITLTVGFALNALVPSIPLAAAFALGAALGPTDPLAVASVSKRAAIPARQKTVLQGESLLNDASGIVSFQFAIAAIVTGYFSVFDAVASFAYVFFGALIVGIIMGYLYVKLAEKVRDWGLENSTFHVALELLAPFIAYLLGEAIHVSGVILVVACGITSSVIPRTMGPSASRANIVSSSVWKVLTFALNGIVFVLLGTQLPDVFGDIWADTGISNVDLIVLIVLITAIMHVMRFIWTLALEARVFHGMGEHPKLGQRLRSAAVMTLSGSKGAITLAIMFTIPHNIIEGTNVVAFPQRDLLIFIACGVILLSLLLATFIVPVLAPRKEDESATRERDNLARADILRAVIEELTSRQNAQNRIALSQVIGQYNDRLERYKERQDLEDESDMELRLQALEWEQVYVLDLVDKDEVAPLEGYQYVSRVARVASMTRREKHRELTFLSRYRRMRTFARKLFARFRRHLPVGSESKESSAQIMRDIQRRAALHVIGKLKEIMPESDLQSEKISQLIREYEHTLRLISSSSPSITAFAQQATPDLDAMRLGLRIELEQIQLAYDEGRLSLQAARRMRQNVYLMQLDIEDYV